MNDHPFPPARSSRRHATRVLLPAAAALALAACQSALSPDYGGDTSERYYQSLVAREILTGNYGAHALDAPAPTVIGGVREFARVDTPGPATASATAPGAGSDSSPATAPALATTDIGRDSATLRMPEPVFGLSLQDAIARTLKHSLAIKVEAYNPAIKEALVVQAMDIFDPILFGQPATGPTSWSVANDPIQYASSSFLPGQTFSNQFGIKRLLPTGAQAQVTTDFTYRDIPSNMLSLGQMKSTYGAAVTATVTQPLLRGFGSDVNEANIYLTQRDLRISQSVFKQRVMSSVADVEDAYQNLLLARINVEVLERLVNYSKDTYETVLKRGKIDTTVISENQAASTFLSRVADLHVAQKVYRDASDKLKGLLNDPELDINSNILINPTDPLAADPVHYDILGCIEMALRQRPEMQQARLQLERADIVIRVARNALLPQVDLTLIMKADGMDHGLDGAYTNVFDPMNHMDFGVGIQFQIPIGNRDAEYKLQQHQAERNQAITNLVQVAQQVAQDVKNQLREVLSSYDELEFRRQVREATEKEVNGIIQSREIRAHTPEFLAVELDSQARLATAEQQISQALVNYNLAIMRLEQAKGTLLEFDRISLDKAPKQPQADPLNALRFDGKTYLPK